MAVKKKSARKKKKSTKKKKAAGKNTRKKGWKLPLLKYGFFPLLVLFVCYMVYLDFTIRNKFEGKRWEIPARVYARPLELYAGKVLSPPDLLYELKLLRYTYSTTVGSPGTYTPVAGGYVVYTRPFSFWDGKEKASKVRILFQDRRITRIERHANRSEVALLRMDPAMIAGIYPRHNEDRILVKHKDVPKTLIGALIAVEDRKFLKHRGIDFRAIARAMWANLRAGRTVQGGSTLTQQLVKNFFLTNRRSLWRKINEALMAPLLEWHYTKEEILEAYLNEIYLGQDGKRSINGFGLASRFYFNRPIQQLNLHEIALLVGMVKGASYYDPRKHPGRALKRRNLVLKLMADQGVIARNDAIHASKQPLGVVAGRTGGVTAYPAFLDLVKRQLRRDYKEEDLTSEGLRIFTTLDPLIQRRAENSLAQKIKQLENWVRLKKGQLEGAVVVSSVEQAEVLAVVGGRRTRYAGFNRALDAVRQIGSLVKPAVYLSALKSKKYSLATPLDDSPFLLKTEEGKEWTPQNYDKEFHGAIPLFVSLMNSYNVSTARLGMEIGLGTVKETLEKLGVKRHIRAYPSLLLGAISMSPLEVTQMYQTIAASGFYSPLRSIRAVMDTEGKPLQRYPLTVGQVFGAKESLLLKKALQLVTVGGTARALRTQLPEGLEIAGKTGTTDDLRDSWFAGFSGDKLAVVWLGTDNNQTTKLTGSTGAMSVWGALMPGIAETPVVLDMPEGMEKMWIDSRNGKKSWSHCEGAIELPFIRGTGPTEETDCSSGLPRWLNRLFGR